MYYTGFADEAGLELDVQIRATKKLGWHNIEARRIGAKYFAFLDDREFDELCGKLAENNVSINCYGSGVGNSEKTINTPPDSSYEEMKQAIPKMQKLGIKFIRMMSFRVPLELRGTDYTEEVVKRVKVIVKMAGDAGITCLHENCANWGGMSYENTLKLLDKVNSPNLKLVFDTGNPVSSDDVRGVAPYKKQNVWEFYQAVKGSIAYIHIKDTVYDAEAKKTKYTYPDEGNGEIRRIVKDLLKGGYDGGFSIEPHMNSLLKDSTPDAAFENYVEYGRRFMTMFDEIKKELTL